MSDKKMNPWQKEVSDFARAFSGAFLFGIPLLFTMEMWWIGSYAPLWKLTLFLVLTFFLTIGINFAIGFKKESTFNNVIIQAINTTAVGIIASAIVLVILNKITFDTPLNSILGKIILQTVPLSIGASLGNSLLGQQEKNREGSEKQQKHKSAIRITIQTIAASVIGGIFIGFAIAPTEEIPMLAAEPTFFHEIAILFFSLGLSYMIVYESGFDPQEKRHSQYGYLKNPLTESMTAYIISLLVSATALYFFGRIESSTPIDFALSQVLVLGVPTAIGAAAGRIVV